jgi:hypothetical protein
MRKKKKNGKIKKVKKGYTPNCSSGMWMFNFCIICPVASGVTGVVSIIATILIRQLHKAKQKNSEMTMYAKTKTDESSI